MALLGAGLSIDFPNGTLLSFEVETAVAYLPTDRIAARLSGSVVLGWRFGDRRRWRAAAVVGAGGLAYAPGHEAKRGPGAAGAVGVW
ncbi:MAG: hypothetical protein H6712_06230 [Myxococcales bacterium]|nr:hypothetical protein [Myxococcales bacterium]MCB9713432.1 hypothetical protein [Myxococcales bacterium]